jgi:hypothetical protein
MTIALFTTSPCAREKSIKHSNSLFSAQGNIYMFIGSLFLPLPTRCPLLKWKGDTDHFL